MLPLRRVGFHCIRVLKVSTRGIFTEGFATVGIDLFAARPVLNLTLLIEYLPTTAGHFSKLQVTSISYKF